MGVALAGLLVSERFKDVISCLSNNLEALLRPGHLGLVGMKQHCELPVGAVQLLPEGGDCEKSESTSPVC